MPYKIQGNCVHKLNPDDSLGEVVKCHDTPEAAMAHMKALYANEPGAKPAAESAGVRSGYFAEMVDLRESELDSAEFVARGVTLIRPGFSTNTDKAGRPRYYAADVLRQSVPVFEGTRAYVNHPRQSDAKELPERDVRDLVGYYDNVHAADDGKLRADFRVVGAAREWLWPMVEETRRKPDFVALSINALGQTRLGEAEGRKAVIVEAIAAANSVDVVTTGAAGGTFAGSLLHSDPDQWTRNLLNAMTFDEWREARQDFIDRLKAEWKTVRDSEAVKTARAEIETLKGEIARLHETSRANETLVVEYRRAEAADGLLNESGLPLKLRAAVRADLLAAKDEPEMRAIIERERAKYAAAPKAPVPVSGFGQRPVETRRPVTKAPNAAAALLGLNESRMPKPGESAEQYKARMREEVR